MNDELDLDLDRLNEVAAQVRRESNPVDLLDFPKAIWEGLKTSLGDMAKGFELEAKYQKPRSIEDDWYNTLERRLLPSERERQGLRISELRGRGVDPVLARRIALDEIWKTQKDEGRVVTEGLERQRRIIDGSKNYQDYEALEERRRKARQHFWGDVANVKALQGDPRIMKSDSPLVQLGLGIGQSLGYMAPTVLHPAAGAMAMYQGIKGGVFRELAPMVGDERALRAASIDAFWQMPLEFAGEMLMLKNILSPTAGAFSKYLINIARGMGQEGLTEAVQQYPDHMAAFWAMNPDLEPSEFASELFSGAALKESLYAGMLGALSGGIIIGAGSLAMSGARRASEFITEKQRQRNLAKRTEMADILKRGLAGQELSGREQRIFETAVDNIHEGLRDSLVYYQAPIETENRQRIHDGLRETLKKPGQADAVMEILDSIAGAYGERLGVDPKVFYERELVDFIKQPFRKFIESRNEDERLAAQYQDGHDQGRQTDLEAFVDEQPVLDANGKQNKALYKYSSKSEKEAIIRGALSFLSRFQGHGKDNPIEGKFGHKIYFEPDPRSVQRLGRQRAILEYGLHAVTEQIDKKDSARGRRVDLSKARSLDLIEAIIKDADGHFTQQESTDGKRRVIYYKEVREGKRPYGAVVLELEERDGKFAVDADSLRFVTHMPDKKKGFVKRTPSEDPASEGLNQGESAGATFPDSIDIIGTGDGKVKFQVQKVM